MCNGLSPVVLHSPDLILLRVTEIEPMSCVDPSPFLFAQPSVAINRFRLFPPEQEGYGSKVGLCFYVSGLALRLTRTHEISSLIPSLRRLHRAEQLISCLCFPPFTHALSNPLPSALAITMIFSHIHAGIHPDTSHAQLGPERACSILLLPWFAFHARSF
jgi:hypothetical protein